MQDAFDTAYSSIHKALLTFLWLVDHPHENGDIPIEGIPSENKPKRKKKIRELSYLSAILSLGHVMQLEPCAIFYLSRSPEKCRRLPFLQGPYT